MDEQLVAGQIVGMVSGEPNQTYAVQFSSDLLSWSALATNKTGANGTFQFSDSGSADQRFYRIVELP
jgi:hypothetical protein